MGRSRSRSSRGRRDRDDSRSRERSSKRRRRERRSSGRDDRDRSESRGRRSRTPRREKSDSANAEDTTGHNFVELSPKREPKSRSKSRSPPVSSQERTISPVNEGNPEDRLVENGEGAPSPVPEDGGDLEPHNRSDEQL